MDYCPVFIMVCSRDLRIYITIIMQDMLVIKTISFPVSIVILAKSYYLIKEQ